MRLELMDSNSVTGTRISSVYFPSMLKRLSRPSGFFYGREKLTSRSYWDLTPENSSHNEIPHIWTFLARPLGCCTLLLADTSQVDLQLENSLVTLLTPPTSLSAPDTSAREDATETVKWRECELKTWECLHKIKREKSKPNRKGRTT